MKVIELQKFPEDDGLLGRRVADPHDYTVVRPGTIITASGEPELIYGDMAEEFKTIIAILKEVRYSKNRRLTQLLNQTEVNRVVDVTFGYKPHNPVFGTPAGACRLNSEAPNWYAEIMKLGEFLLTKYKAFAPKRFLEHCKSVESQVAPHWRIGKTPYTQGVINNANALGYHYDRDNFPGVWSCMAYFMSGVKGGDLVIPSLRAKLLCSDHTYVLFNGQSLMHGVTPIRKTRPSGYRYSIVYYSRKSMKGLGSYDAELTKIKAQEVRKHAKRMEAHK